MGPDGENRKALEHTTITGHGGVRQRESELGEEGEGGGGENKRNRER